MYPSGEDLTEEFDYIIHQVDLSGMGEVPNYEQDREVFEQISQKKGNELIGGGCSSSSYFATMLEKGIPGIDKSIWEKTSGIVEKNRNYIGEEQDHVIAIHSTKPSREIVDKIREKNETEGLNLPVYDFENDLQNIEEIERIFGTEKQLSQEETNSELSLTEIQGKHDDALNERSSGKEKTKRKWKKIQFQKGMKSRAFETLQVAEEILGEDFFNFYKSNDPLLKEPSSEEYGNFVSSFQYAHATKYFTCSTKDGRNVFMPRTLAIVYKGMTFLPCTYFNFLIGKEKARKLLNPVIKYFEGRTLKERNQADNIDIEERCDVYQDKRKEEIKRNEVRLMRFPLTRIQCQAVSCEGNHFIRPRYVMSGLGLFLMCQWTSMMPSYEKYTEILEQYLKYIDIEFGCYHGRMQFAPFTHSLRDLNLTRGPQDSLEDIYENYCCHQFEIIRDTTHYSQYDVHKGNFSKNYGKENRKDHTHFENSKKESPQGERGEKRKRNTSEESDSTEGHHKKKLNSSERNEQEKDCNEEGEEDNSKEVLQNDEQEESGLEHLERKKFIPFSFSIKWESDRVEKGRNTTKHMSEYLVLSSLGYFPLHKDNVEAIDKWLLDYRSDGDVSKFSMYNRRDLKNPGVFIDRLKSVKVGLYSGSKSFSKEEEMTDALESGNALNITHIADACSRISSNMDKSDVLPRNRHNKFESSWISVMYRTLNPLEYGEPKDSNRNVKKPLFYIRCTKRSLRSAFTSDGSTTRHRKNDLDYCSNYCGLPIFDEKRMQILSLINRYVQKWPSQAVFFKKRNKVRDVVPFWVLTFFALAMNSREADANGSPLMLCHRIYRSLEEWYEENKELMKEFHTKDEITSFFEGVKIFRQSFLMIESMIMDPTLSSSLHLTNSFNLTHVLAGMLDRTIEERDAMLIYLMDTVFPLLKHHNLSEKAAESMSPLVVTEMRRMLAYGQKMYASEENKLYRQQLADRME